MKVERIYALGVLVVVTGCAALGVNQLEDRFGKAEPRERVVEELAPQAIDYWTAVEPIIEKRCVVCHACYDAQCQLNMSSIEGIERGASQTKVYNPARVNPAQTTRLFQDAHSTAEWRDKGFFPVLNEHVDTPEANREASLLYRILKLKQDNPLPDDTLLPASFELSIGRKQSCPKPESFDKFSRKNPLWGMPYALPAMPAAEQSILMSWIVQGASYLPRSPLDPVYQPSIDRWESFLNGDSLKQQLVNRYIYEHLAFAHLYFSAVDDRKFFQLVRSATPPGEPIEIIATRRPHNDPQVSRVYYRIREHPETVVAKTHMPYRLDDARMQRWQSLFTDAAFEVTELPSYDADTASNPFLTFKDLPVRSRYKFMLDEAQFTIMGFIKGPVCRGPVALNVINDRFWVFFVDPDEPAIDETDAFYAGQSANLALPAGTEKVYNPARHWRRYAAQQKTLMENKDLFFSELLAGGRRVGLDVVWDGNGSNQNASLTVFRHFNSATVEKGLLGTPPKTAWLVGYSVLERVHYLLVSGFDVYGNLGHQMLTRLYMDFLRMESEADFLMLLPEPARSRERSYWYRGAEKDVQNYMRLPSFESQLIPAIDYETEDEKLELFAKLEQRLDKVLPTRHTMAEIQDSGIRNALDQLNQVVGTAATLMPETAFVRIRATAGDEYVTLVHNNAHLNITSMLGEKKTRAPDEDTLSIIPGFIGSYPNGFFVVDESELITFVNSITAPQSEDDYSQLLDTYGVRRTNSAFWKNSDTFHAAYERLYPLEFGLLDYNRLENR